MPLKSDKRIRVAKNRKTPLEPTNSAGFFAPFLFCAQLLGGGHQTRRGPATHSRGGASEYYCAGSLMRVYSFCRSSHEAGSKSTAPTGMR